MQGIPERKRAVALFQGHDDLDMRVAERTTALEDVNGRYSYAKRRPFPNLTLDLHRATQ